VQFYLNTNTNKIQNKQTWRLERGPEREPERGPDNLTNSRLQRQY